MKKALSIFAIAISIIACTKKESIQQSQQSNNNNTVQDSRLIGVWSGDSSRRGTNSTVIYTGMPIGGGYASDSLFITAKLNEYTYSAGKLCYRMNMAWKTSTDSLITSDSFGNSNLRYYYSIVNNKLVTCYNSSGNKSYFWYHKVK